MQIVALAVVVEQFTRMTTPTVASISAAAEAPRDYELLGREQERLMWLGTEEAAKAVPSVAFRLPGEGRLRGVSARIHVEQCYVCTMDAKPNVSNAYFLLDCLSLVRVSKSAPSGGLAVLHPCFHSRRGCDDDHPSRPQTLRVVE